MPTLKKNSNIFEMQKIAQAVQLQVTGKTIKMHYTKAGWLIADLIGIPTSLYGMWLNIDNIKSAIIALLVISYLSLRIYYYWKRSEIEIKEREIQLWEKELNKQERLEKRDKANEERQQ